MGLAEFIFFEAKDMTWFGSDILFILIWGDFFQVPAGKKCQNLQFGHSIFPRSTSSSYFFVSTTASLSIFLPGRNHLEFTKLQSLELLGISLFPPSDQKHKDNDTQTPQIAFVGITLTLVEPMAGHCWTMWMSLLGAWSLKVRILFVE